ncbi:MAG TPA: manganese catalase family protein [Thermomicrobiales bacterium]|nr:manganese catalase family protein [Thermomicrobiales bacterium]
MITRFDRVAVELPRPSAPNANGAAAVQELMGGKFGELSTFMNYQFQSMNFRGRDAKHARPFFDLIANIAAEEHSHIELVGYTINLLLTGTSTRGTDPSVAPLDGTEDNRNTLHFIASGQAALPVDSMGRPWTGDNVFSSGNLKLDLLHNFFLECGARANKIRVYETTDDPTVRAMTGYLLVRGGVHVVAYARALEVLTGADLGKLFPIPDISNKAFPEAKALEDQGLHRILFRNNPQDYTRVGEVWKGKHPEDGSELIVQDGRPEGAPPPVLEEEPQLTAPGIGAIDDDTLREILKRLEA